VTTDEDYYVTHEATRLAAERAGGEVRSIPLFEELASVTAEQLVETIVGGVGPATRVLALTWEGLAAAPGVTLHTPLAPELSAGIVAFDIDGADPHAAVRSLRQRGVVASVAPYATQH